MNKRKQKIVNILIKIKREKNFLSKINKNYLNKGEPSSKNI